MLFVHFNCEIIKFGAYFGCFRFGFDEFRAFGELNSSRRSTPGFLNFFSFLISSSAVLPLVAACV